MDLDDVIRQLQSQIDDKNKIITNLESSIGTLESQVDMLQKNAKANKLRQLYKPVKNKKLELASLFIPTYQLNQLRQPAAIIIAPGKQGIIRKLPSRGEYFIDRDLGFFKMNPDNILCFVNKVPIYLFDMRSANNYNPWLFNELYKWARLNNLYKIRRVDIQHGIRLRIKGKQGLKEEQLNVRQETRAFSNKIISDIDAENAKKKAAAKKDGTKAQGQEYHLTNESEKNFLIVENLLNFGYITPEQAQDLNDKLTRGEIVKPDQLLNEIEQYTEVLVSEPLAPELDRVLDDFHTYTPRDVLTYILQVSKIHKGFKNLRTKKIINWFPSTYILFGCVGIAVIIMLYLGYTNQQDLASILPTGSP